MCFIRLNCLYSDKTPFASIESERTDSKDETSLKSHASLGFAKDVVKVSIKSVCFINVGIACLTSCFNIGTPISSVLCCQTYEQKHFGFQQGCYL